MVLFIFGISVLTIFISSQRHTLSEIYRSSCHLEEPSVRLHLINSSSYFKSHLEYPPSSPVSPWLLSLTWFPLAFASCNPWVQWTHLLKGSLFQMRVFHSPRAEGSLSFHHWLQPPSQASAPYPSFGKGTFQWQLFLSFSFFSWLKGWSNLFCNSPVWEYILEIYVP